jgi:hypothetical protein
MHRMSTLGNRQSTHNANLSKIGVENKLLRYEVIKRNGAFLIELCSHWVTHTVKDGFTITHNHRDVLATIFPCMDVNEPYASPPRDVAGAVAWTKAFSTRTGIPMTVNLPN